MCLCVPASVCLYVHVWGSVGVSWPACVMLFASHVIQMPFCSQALHLLSPQLTHPESNTCKHAQIEIEIQMDTHTYRHAIQSLSQQKITSCCPGAQRLCDHWQRIETVCRISLILHLYISLFVLSFQSNLSWQVVGNDAIYSWTEVLKKAVTANDVNGQHLSPVLCFFKLLSRTFSINSFFSIQGFIDITQHYFLHKQFSLANKFSLLCKNVTLPSALEQTDASERNPDGITFPSQY